MSDPYSDEWYDDFYEANEAEPEMGAYFLTVVKAPNGQLYVKETVAWTDGIHADSYYFTWESKKESLAKLDDRARRTAVERGKKLKPGEDADISDWWLYDDDEPEIDDSYSDGKDFDDFYPPEDDPNNVGPIPF